MRTTKLFTTVVIVLSLILLLESKSKASTQNCDSIYFFPDNVSASEAIYVVAQACFSSFSCYLASTSLSTYENTITVRLCYIVGVAMQPCYRIDTINIGTYLTGNYTIKVDMLTGDPNCNIVNDSITKTIGLFVGLSEIVNIVNDTLTLTPNPTTTTLTITANTTNTTAQIFTIEGKAATQKIPLVNTNTVIDVAMLPKGLYFVALQSKAGYALKKFVKE